MQKMVLIMSNTLSICKAIKYNLQDIYTSVYYTIERQDGFRRYLEKNYCLLILEMNCCAENDLRMLSYMRRIKSTPILVISNTNSVEYKISCLNMGADGFLTLDFCLEECLSMAKALIRRYTELNHWQHKCDVIYRGGLTLDKDKMSVWKLGQPLQLTVREFQLLYYLALNAGIVLNKEQIYYYIWKEEMEEDSNSVETMIMRLRKKIEVNPSKPSFIETVRGGGYRFKAS